MPENKFALTATELTLNRLFAVLLILSTPMLLFNIFTIPTVIIFFIFAFFLFFAKKYRPVANVIFLLIALGVYFVPLPIDWGFFLGLREFRENGYAFNQIFIFFYLSPFIFISLSVRNVLGNILSYFKPDTRLRTLVYFISLLVVMTAILAYPLLTSIKLRHKAMENTTGSSALSLAVTKEELIIEPGTSGSSTTALARRSYTANFDPATNTYVYRLNLKAPLENALRFEAVKVDGETIDFMNDTRIACPHCQIDAGEPNSLGFPGGQPVDFILTSDRFIKTIEFVESENNFVDFVFWK